MLPMHVRRCYQCMCGTNNYNNTPWTRPTSPKFKSSSSSLELSPSSLTFSKYSCDWLHTICPPKIVAKVPPPIKQTSNFHVQLKRRNLDPRISYQTWQPNPGIPIAILLNPTLPLTSCKLLTTFDNSLSSSSSYPALVAIYHVDLLLIIPHLK